MHTHKLHTSCSIHLGLLSFAGIADFIDTALKKDTAVGLVAGTCSIPEEQIMTAALFALGEERSQKLHTFVCNPQQESQDSEGQQGSFDGLSLEQGMAAARARVRSTCACYCCFGPHALLLRTTNLLFPCCFCSCCHCCCCCCFVSVSGAMLLCHQGLARIQWQF